MTDLAVCVHGHFYQPPREDPLTGEIPLEPGAAPYRNWNERIHAQCYRPNAELGNFERISFNLGPTLAQWMAEEDPQTLALIVQQERSNFLRYGVGNGMAQSYHHTILPLAPRRDKVTQVRWGVEDFKYRFGHVPQGLWMPEAGSDLETLEVLAECGVQFTILAPWQARQVVDNRWPYRVALPGGQYMAVFFYDQELSMRVSFDPGATVNGDSFLLSRLLPRFDPNLEREQLLTIASDGELYGHHQPFRDKFLQYLLNGAMERTTVRAVYPALWLKKYPPQTEVEIVDGTSWSCHHGILRWSGDCACTPHADWKAPLRQGLDRLAAMIDEQYENALRPLGVDPWELRHRYIHVLLGQTTVRDLAGEMARRTLTEEEAHKVELLLQAQYERQRMFASCGWFFDDFDRIEPRNNVSYAAQAVWITYLATGVDLSRLAADLLAPVRSWRSGLRADTVFQHTLERHRSSQQAAD